jgi:Kef-type K+ transport system membrane component KefB
MESHVIGELAICIVTAWLLGVTAQALRQPLLLAYLAAGFIIGPVGLNLVHSKESIESISGIGLILLLFLIGLEIDLKKILGTGRLIIITALAQIFGSWILGVTFFRLLGFSLGAGKLDALYLGLAAALSSTVIIVKLLYEKRELDTLQGRLTLGVLVLQDLVAILFLAIQPNLLKPTAGVLLLSCVKVLVLLAVSFAVSRYALPPIFRSVARLPELVLVGAMAWCFLVAGAAGALELSREMGALIAGVAISTFPYTLDIAAKLTSLRDFFVTLFFVALGMAVPKPTANLIEWALITTVFVFATRFLTVFPCLHWMRQGYRSSVLPSLNLAQISELSLVILALGSGLGHVTPQAQGVIAYAFVIVGVLSSYGITMSEPILRIISPLLFKLGLRDQGGETELYRAHPSAKATIYLLGFSWTASSLLEEITRHSPNLLNELLVIDYNPNVNRELRGRRIPVVYGDITQRDTLLHAGIGEAEVIVSSLPNTVLRGATNLKLLQQLRDLNKSARIIMHAELFSDVPKLYAAGADYVFVPRLIEAEELRKLIEAARTNLIQEKRAGQDDELEGRHEVIP